MTADPRTRMLACATHDGDIAEGALWMAADDRPECDPHRWLPVLDEIGLAIRERCRGRPAIDSVPTIAEMLRDRLHLRGAGGGDPRAHYLDSVMERGCGVPIACSALWIAVGRRAGLPVEGVGLPGRFVVRVGGALVDPFAGGELLEEAAARSLVASVLGSEPLALDPAWLGATSPRSMLARMSRNLRGCYASVENWPLALRAADRCVLLAPDEPAERRDRGLIHWRIGRHGEALDDLQHYLHCAPEASDRAGIESVVGRLRAALN